MNPLASNSSLMPFDFEGCQIRVFTLVLGSRKPEAMRFKCWVTHEVLPAIRRTGSYAVPGLGIAPAPLSSDKQDSVGARLLIGQAVAQVPGVKPGIAMAAPFTCIQENTGLATETLRLALPAAPHRPR